MSDTIPNLDTPQSQSAGQDPSTPPVPEFGDDKASIRDIYGDGGKEASSEAPFPNMPKADGGDQPTGEEGANSIFGGDLPERTPAEPPKENAPQNLEDVLKLPDGVTEKSTKNFQVVKDIAKEQRERADKLEAQLAEFKKAPSGDPDLQSKYESVSEKLRVADLKNHPDFIEKFETPKQQLTDSLNEILKENELGVSVASILNKKGKALADAVEDVVDGLPRLHQNKFINGIEQLQELAGMRQEALDNAKASSDVLTQMSTESMNNAFNKAWEGLSTTDKTFVKPLQVAEGADVEQINAIDAFNSELGQVQDNARNILSNPLSNDEMSNVAIKAAQFDFFMKQGFPRMEVEYKQAVGLIQELTSEIEALKGYKPSAGGYTNSSAAAKTMADMGTKEAVSAAFGR